MSPLSHFIALDKKLSTILRNSGKTGHSCLAPYLRGNPFSYPILYYVGYAFVNIAFIMLKYAYPETILYP